MCPADAANGDAECGFRFSSVFRFVHLHYNLIESYERMKWTPSVNIGIRLIILASLGCNNFYCFSAIACEILHEGCPDSDVHRTQGPSAISVQHLFNLFNAHPNLIHTEHVLVCCLFKNNNFLY